jgi:hypothetical protein
MRREVVVFGLIESRPLRISYSSFTESIEPKLDWKEKLAVLPAKITIQPDHAI